MTDNDIIKTLESIASEAIGDCKRDCAFYDGRVHYCAGVISRYALDLIKRYKAENEMYEKTVGKLAIKDGEVVGILDGKETAYIEKAVASTLRRMAIKTARAEAIKEFAERLKAEGFHHKNFGDLVQFEDIDALVKEMTEETNHERTE